MSIQAILLGGLALFLLPSAVFSQDDHHSQPSPERVFYFERQEVHIQEFEVAGPILDLGGGGEGVIGRLKRDTVHAGQPMGGTQIIMQSWPNPWDSRLSNC